MSQNMLLINQGWSVAVLRRDRHKWKIFEDQHLSVSLLCNLVQMAWSLIVLTSEVGKGTLSHTKSHWILTVSL